MVSTTFSVKSINYIKMVYLTQNLTTPYSKLLVFLFLILPFSLYSQSLNKRSLDTSDAQNFKSLIYSDIKVSGNGQYVVFTNAHTRYNFFAPKTIKSLNDKWEMMVNEPEGEIVFSSDSRIAIFLQKDKRLGIIQLGTDKIEYISGVDSYKLLPDSKDQNYLVIDKRGSGAGVILRELSTGKEYNYGSPEQFIFTSKYSVLVVAEKNGQQSVYHFENGKEAEKIWSGSTKITQLSSSVSGSRVAFSTKSDIFYYEQGKTSSVAKLDISKIIELAELTLSGDLRFSPQGNLLLFKMKKPLEAVNPSVNPVDIFSYLDGEFDWYHSRSALTFDCVYDCRTKKIIRVCYESERLKSISEDENSLFITKVEGRYSEYRWNKKGLHKDFVLLVNSGKEIPVKTERAGNLMSPSGQFVIGHNEYYFGDIFSLDVRNDSTYNLTGNLPVSMNHLAGNPSAEIHDPNLKWSERILDNRLIIYDRYDVWMVDLEKREMAVCLTNGYGRKHQIIFRIPESTTSYSNGNEIILSAYDQQNKNAGFYKVRVGAKADPTRLSMGKYHYSQLTRCGQLNRWVIKRMSATEAPNFFWTEDFKSFQPITNFYPEKNLLWYTTELINYVTKDGVKSQAILYKPENFDPAKKYPVLFSLYEEQSQDLHKYLLPDYTDEFSFNIPLMLSRGYLVCRPDIHFKVGETARNIVDCVEGAADYLSKLPFIDSLHYGASGGSYGGYGVNCLAAFSHKFKALVPISGLSDYISGYANVPGPFVDMYESSQIRMGVSLSTDPMRYLHNSPVIYSRNVTTPVLIVNTPRDLNVNVQQGIEWFISLRREGKQAWMLRYNGAEVSHGIYVIEDQKDLDIRMTQFFDHYLKGSPAPAWMTEEIKIQETGVRNRYEYNPAVKVPPPSPVRDRSKFSSTPSNSNRK